MKADEFRFDELKIGQRASYRHRVSEKEIDAFAHISGDTNPLHMDADFAAEAKFQGRVVHGMFLGALVSQLVGMKLPGLHSLLLTEQLDFKKPVYVDDDLSIEGNIRHKSESTKIVEIEIKILRDGESVADGMARVRLLR